MTDERRPIRYLIVPKDGIDVIHRDPGEQCQMDDTDREQAIDQLTAEGLIRNDHARQCGHCWPEDDGA